MDRLALHFLIDWLQSASRKPLLIRGARQVGKTWLVRRLAELQKKKLIELNFEKRPEYRKFFSSNDPKEVLLYLEAALQTRIEPETSLLFLDEVQAAPELISKLRWFAEDLPALAVIATGSLLEFTLCNYPYSMPVGRIGYLYLEPFSFEEFLIAHGKESLLEYLRTLKIQENKTIPAPIHDLAMTLFKEYLFVGGLPAAVAAWTEHRSLIEIHEIHQNLLSTYRDDFSKYADRLPHARLEDVFMAIPRMVGKKFIYSHVNKEAGLQSLKQALELLLKAKLCNKVRASAGNGVPLAAEVKENFFKIVFLDTGLVSSLLGLKIQEWLHCQEILLVNQGALAEQVVAQQLRTIEPFYIEPSLYYWVREEKTASAEIDYLLQHQGQIVPVEVKAGSTGQLKSLHLFMALKKLPLAVRIQSAMPSLTPIQFQTQLQSTARYQLLSIPFYLIGQLPRLLDELKK